MLNSSAVTVAQLLEARKEEIVSQKMKLLLEELKRELDRKAVRRNVKLMTLIKRYRPTASERERSVIRKHLLPMAHLTMAQLDVKRFCEEHLDKPRSTAVKIFTCFERIMRLHDPSFRIPKVRFRNPGKKWTTDHILEETQVLDVIHNHVIPKYRPVCLIAAYSGLRLGNVVGLTAAEVDLGAGWLNIKAQTKTKKPVQIPIAGKLANVFKTIKRWPLDGGLLFPDLQGTNNAISAQVRRAFKWADIPWGSFHHFRHFAACHLLNHGVSLEVVRDILGHSDFRSTLVYARVKRETLKQAARAFDATG